MPLRLGRGAAAAEKTFFNQPSGGLLAERRE